MWRKGRGIPIAILVSLISGSTYAAVFKYRSSFEGGRTHGPVPIQVSQYFVSIRGKSPERQEFGSSTLVENYSTLPAKAGSAAVVSTLTITGRV